MSYPCLWIDEIDESPAEIKGQGDTVELIVNRTLVPYGESIAKILYMSTPTTTQTSRIFKLFMEGDQRKYFIPCPRCGDLITLEWHIAEDKTKSGLKAGIVFDLTESGNLDYGTVFYRCQSCGKLISNDEKAVMLPGGEWRAQAETSRERLKTYHVNALYSPVGIFSWTGAVDIFLKGWDVKNNRVNDILKYRSFRNNIQGLPFEEKGEGIKYETIISHRRSGFIRNVIPNHLAMIETESPVLILLMSVDVQKNCLYADIKGYCKDGQSWTIDFRKIEPVKNDQFDCTNINCTAWLQLEKIIRDEVFVSDDNKRYFVRTTFIDSGKWPDTVYEFCSWFGFDVIPIKGQDVIKSGVNFQQMSKTVIDKLSGRPAYIIAVDNFKSRIASIFKSERKNQEDGLQPSWTMNFPEDFPDSYFKMFTSESQKAIKNKLTNRIVGMKWVASGENHAGDTAVYNFAGLEIVATNLCLLNGMEFIDWEWFWNFCLDGNFYE
jgi:phage terminase large subunit GpA-like protein